MNPITLNFISLISAGILFFVGCSNVNRSAKAISAPKPVIEQVQPLKIGTYYLELDSGLIKLLCIYNDGDRCLHYMQHDGKYKETDLGGKYDEPYAKLLVKLILESTDGQNACRILKEYYLNSRLQAAGHWLYFTEDRTYIYMRNRVDSIFGVKLLRYNDSINERWIALPYNREFERYGYPNDFHYYSSFIVNPKIILPEKGKEALDEYCKLPCDSLIRLLKEAVNKPSDYYYIPPIEE